MAQRRADGSWPPGETAWRDGRSTHPFGIFKGCSSAEGTSDQEFCLTRRDHVSAPILAGVRSPRPAHWTRIDADYENLCVSMHAFFDDLGIRTSPAAA
jgi:hypothetical protein